jgi:hypothetical protein
MPKITEHDGPTHDPQDAPNARPTEEAYTDAMSRHGTPAFTPADERLAAKYRAMRKQEAEEERQQAQADGILVGEKGPEIRRLNEETDEPVEYRDLKKDELVAEIHRRNEGRAAEDALPVSGTKDELVTWLEADDDERNGQE